jgi:sulfopyruvate decarboxylase subunit alpha
MTPGTIETTVAALKSAGVTIVCQVPDSWLAPLGHALEADPHFQFVTATNEGEGVALCAGAWLGGTYAVMLMENSGVRMACEELARLGLGQGIPVFMLMPYRGDLGDGYSWAQAHGWTMAPVLDALRADYRILRDESEIPEAISGALKTMTASRNHVALIYGKALCAPDAKHA